MNRFELKDKLDELQIPHSDYSLDGTLLPMRTILLSLEGKWITFDYDERGRTQDKKQFDAEDEACQHILKRLIYLKEWRIKYNIL